MGYFSSSREKIFCIGANKTGTTSVEQAFLDLNFKLGNQHKAQDLIEHYKRRDFKQIAKFCKSATVFQDAPFSWHYTGVMMHQFYPDAKFILTVRDSPEQWYHSLVNFHKKLLGISEGLPTIEQMKNKKRGDQTTMWSNFNVRHDIQDEDPYNKDRLIAYYNDHNRIIKDYFRFSKNLLVINLSDSNSYARFCDFVNVKPLYDQFPWKNKT